MHNELHLVLCEDSLDAPIKYPKRGQLQNQKLKASGGKGPTVTIRILLLHRFACLSEFLIRGPQGVGRLQLPS